MFDGDCAMCSGSVQLLLKLDRSRRLHFLPIESERGSAIYRELGLDPTDASTMVLLADERAFTKSDAVLHVARSLGLPWSLAALFLLVPVGIRDRIYDLIARNRHRFSRSDRCVMVRPEDRARFLE